MLEIVAAFRLFIISRMTGQEVDDLDMGTTYLLIFGFWPISKGIYLYNY